MKGKKEFRKIRALLCLMLAAVLIFGTVPIEPAFASESETTQGTEELMESGGTDSDTQADGEDQEEGSVSESDGEDPGSGETEPVEDAETEPEPEQETEPEPATSNGSAAYTNSISGVLWIDTNEDGIYGSSEQPLADYPVYLYLEGDTDNAVQTTTTDGDGRYLFEEMTPGRYIVGIKAEENGTGYLLPLMGVQKDNKFYFTPDYSKVISNAIDIAADTVVEDIGAAMRNRPGIQTMANATYYLDISTLTGTAVTSGGVTISGTVATFPNTLDPTDTYIITQSVSTATSNTVIVANGAAVNITLQGVNMVTTTSPIRLVGTANVNLILSGTNIVRCNNSTGTTTGYYAGIHVPPNATLTIDGTAGDALTISGGRNGAAIGGTYVSSVSASYGNNAAGTIIIEGGTITANSAGNGMALYGYGAAIGGGYFGAGGTVIINGGTVTANSGNASQYGAGIGSGNSGPSGGTVEINAGTVTASGYNGSGIGGGVNSSDAVTIYIYGGTVTATSTYGAGIGGGSAATGGTTEINGGIVDATSTYGAGIGGGGRLANGNGSAGGVITINGGTVTATSDAGAGIGGGCANNINCVGSYSAGAGGTITINDGTVIATTTGDNSLATSSANAIVGGAGIGGGGVQGDGTLTGIVPSGGAGGTITINGGTITARAGTYSSGSGGGAGIGAGGAIGYGSSVSGGTITITGGTVTAQGGYRSAGIGGAGVQSSSTSSVLGSCGNIRISGGTVTATGGRHNGVGGATSASGIGCGITNSTTGYPTAAGNIVFTGGSILPLDYYGAIHVRVNATIVYVDATHSGGTPTNGNTYGAPDQVHLVEFTGYSAYDPFHIVAGGTVSSYGYSANSHPDGTVYAWLAYPGVLTKDATNITPATATLNGEVYLDDSYAASSGYFEWGTSSGSYTSQANISTTSNISGVDPYSANISGLSADTTYYYRLVIVAGGVTVYGNEVSFRTPSAITEHYLKIGDGSALQSTTSGYATIGSTFTGSTGNPPATLISGGDTYTYISYRVGSTTATLTTGNPSFTVIGSTDVYYYYAGPPIVTVSHTGASGTTATLNGTYDLNGGTFTSGYFEIYDGTSWIMLTSTSTISITSATGVTAGTGQVDNSTTTPSITISGLTPGTTYQYRFTVTTNAGTDTAAGSFTAGYGVTEKFVDLNGSPVDSAGLPDNTVYVTGSYTASGIPTSYTVGSDTYTYLGYKPDSYSPGDTLTSGTPSSVTVTGDRDVYYVYAITEGSIKIEKYGHGGAALLSGAEFKLEKLTDTLANGGVVDTSFTARTLTAAGGTCTFSNLPQGIYQITETKAPSGYSPLKEPFEVEIPKDVTYASGVTPADGGYLYPTVDPGTGGVTYHYYDLTYQVTDQAKLQMPVAGSGYLSRYHVWISMVILLAAGVSFAVWMRHRRICR